MVSTIALPFQLQYCHRSDLKHKQKIGIPQGLSERMAKVIYTAGVFIFTKSQFSQLFLLQITPPAHPGPS